MHCRRGQAMVDHRTVVEHECDERCRPHRCRPLGEGTIRHAHNLLNGAFALAVRWEWVGTNPVDEGRRADRASAEPRAAVGLAGSSHRVRGVERPSLGSVRLAGDDHRRAPRRALRASMEPHRLRHGRAHDPLEHRRGRWPDVGEGHQDPPAAPHRPGPADARPAARLPRPQRRASGVARDRRYPRTDSCSRPTRTDRAGRSQVRRPSGTPACVPASATRCTCTSFATTRRPSSSVAVSTSAPWPDDLGHGGGGVTTLRVYSAWVAEADQRASSSLATRMPALPGAVLEDGEAAAHKFSPLPAPPAEAPSDPYEKIAADLEAAIRCGVLKAGERLPTIKEIAAQYQVAAGTGHRAVALLAERGQVVVSRGRRAQVAPHAETRPEGGTARK